MTSTPYGHSYFANRHGQSVHAAYAVLHLLSTYLVDAKVLDLGCGVGTWASIAKELGASSLTGIDGPWIPRNLLHIAPEEFIPHDLSLSLPDVHDNYDLAIWLENAEHLPEGSGEDLLAWLAEQTDCVLFSAAIPGQGGTGHVNERWQSYWAKLFAFHGFQAFDVIRPHIWNEDWIPYWYRQNMLLFARNRTGPRWLQSSVEVAQLPRLDVVHPELWSRHLNQTPAIRKSLKELALATRRKFRTPRSDTMGGRV